MESILLEWLVFAESYTRGKDAATATALREKSSFPIISRYF